MVFFSYAGMVSRFIGSVAELPREHEKYVPSSLAHEQCTRFFGWGPGPQNARLGSPPGTAENATPQR
eukprot:4398147-Pyramimonas_sp.AAC.1